MSNKTVVNSLADGIVQLAILCIYMRRNTNYDWATVNISVLIQQRNISFQNDISLKTMWLGVLSWEKLKNRELGPAWGVTEQKLICLSCLSPGRVKKLQKFITFCLKVGHSVNLKHSKSTWRQLIANNMKSSGHNARSALLDRGTGTNNPRQLLFWHRTFSCDPTNYERCLHPSETFAYRSAHNNSFLMLRVIHELKRGSGFFQASWRSFSRYNKITLNGKKQFLQRLILVKKIAANSNAEKKIILRRNCPTPASHPHKNYMVRP